MLQVLSYEFLKFRILDILNFHPCTGEYFSYTNTSLKDTDFLFFFL